MGAAPPTVNVPPQGLFAKARKVVRATLADPTTKTILTIGVKRILDAKPSEPPEHDGSPIVLPPPPVPRKEEFGGAISASPETGGLKLPANQTSTLIIPASFKMIFLTVTAITVGAGVAQIIMAVHWPHPDGNEQQVFDAMGFAWKAGVGAIFGLLGGKAA